MHYTFPLSVNALFTPARCSLQWSVLREIPSGTQTDDFVLPTFVIAGPDSAFVSTSSNYQWWQMGSVFENTTLLDDILDVNKQTWISGDPAAFHVPLVSGMESSLININVMIAALGIPVSDTQEFIRSIRIDSLHCLKVSTLYNSTNYLDKRTSISRWQKLAISNTFLSLTVPTTTLAAVTRSSFSGTLSSRTTPGNVNTSLLLTFRIPAWTRTLTFASKYVNAIILSSANSTQDSRFRALYLASGTRAGNGSISLNTCFTPIMRSSYGFNPISNGSSHIMVMSTTSLWQTADSLFQSPSFAYPQSVINSHTYNYNYRDMRLQVMTYSAYTTSAANQICRQTARPAFLTGCTTWRTSDLVPITSDVTVFALANSNGLIIKDTLNIPNDDRLFANKQTYIPPSTTQPDKFSGIVTTDTDCVSSLYTCNMYSNNVANTDNIWCKSL